MNPNIQRHNRWRASTALVAVNVAFANLALTASAWAACTPVAATGVTTTCTGMTVNQNGMNGYGTGAEDGMKVTVVSGATVTGTLGGIYAKNYLTVDNSGTITGSGSGNHGIDAAKNLTVNNSGIIIGDYRGISAGNNLTVTNSGIITGNTSNGIDTFDGLTVTNFGTGII